MAHPPYDPRSQGQPQPLQPQSQQPQPFPQQVYQQPYQRQAVAGGVNPVQTTSAEQHADRRYSKGARRGGIWRVFFILSLVVLLAAVSGIGYIFYTYWAGQSEYDQLAEEHMQIQDEGDGSIVSLGSFQIDWEGLRAINPDVVGWIYVPNSVINYPIVWRENDDNYYLKRTFGDNSVGTFGAEYGTVMLSGANSPLWTDQVNIVYGHHLNNGSMFAHFATYEDEAIFNANRTVYVLTPEGNFRVTTFALDKVPGASTDIAIPNFPTQEEFRAYVSQRLADSLVVANPPAPSVDQIKQVFAFSTCSQPDHENRLITFGTVEEFLPAGSDITKGNALVDEEDVANVHGMVDERLL